METQDLSIASNDTAIGVVNVNGDRSNLEVARYLDIGANGHGSLNITGEGKLRRGLHSLEKMKMELVLLM